MQYTNRKKELISVIVPVYNSERTIEKCINSILAQELECQDLTCDIEVIVINDGSTDSTSLLLHDFATKDGRIILVEQPNQGVSAAKNKGLSLASGDFITFCDSDDWVEKDWIISMYKIIRETNADIVKFRCYINDQDISLLPEEITVWERDEAIKEFLIHKKLNGVLCTCLFKNCILDGLPFNTKLCLYEDADIMWRALNRAQKVVRVNDAKYHYVVTGDSLSNGRFTIGKLNSSITFWDKVYCDVEKYHPEYSEIAKKKKFEVYSDCLNKMIIDGVNCIDQEQKIRQYLIKNIKTRPTVQVPLIKRAFTQLAIYLPHIARVIGRLRS